MFTYPDGLLRHWRNDFFILGSLFCSSHSRLRTEIGAIDLHRERAVLKEQATVEKNVVTKAIRGAKLHFYSLIRRAQTVSRLRRSALAPLTFYERHEKL
jgi:hypothetical protein